MYKRCLYGTKEDYWQAARVVLILLYVLYIYILAQVLLRLMLVAYECERLIALRYLTLRTATLW